jgi:hypothetical protein
VPGDFNGDHLDTAVLRPNFNDGSAGWRILYGDGTGGSLSLG